MADVEREMKLRLSGPDELEAIARAAGGVRRPPALQVNHAFDTEAFDLHRARFGLRLREQGGRARLTAKSPDALSADGQVSLRGEVELEVEAPLAAELLAGRRSPLEVLETAGPAGSALAGRLRAAAGGRPVTRVGSFENERHVIAAPLPATGGTLRLELDHTRFPGGQDDYELEVEIDRPEDEPAVRAAVEALLSRAGVEARPSTSKAARFFAALRGDPSV